MGFGRKLPEGALPVFSTNTEEEAQDLIVMTCPMNLKGQYYARELAYEQTLENLQAFSDRLQDAWDHMQKRKQHE